MKILPGLFVLLVINLLLSLSGSSTPLSFLKRGSVAKKATQTAKETKAVKQAEALSKQTSKILKTEEAGQAEKAIQRSKLEEASKVKNTSKEQQTEKTGKNMEQDHSTAKRAANAIKVEDVLVNGVAITLGGTISVVGGYYVIQEDILLGRVISQDKPEFSEDLQNPSPEERIPSLPYIPESIESLKEMDLASRLWKDQVIPYDISEMNTKMKRLIKTAMREWEQKAGVHFIERTKCQSAPDYIKFHSLASDDFRAGAATLGRAGGEQVVLLRINVALHSIFHELGHSLGLNHEHNRPDRDRYVKINYPNILPTAHSDFDKDEMDANIPYNYHSIMHYGSFTSTLINPLKPALTKKDGSLIDWPETITDLDIKHVKLLYSSIKDSRHKSTNNCPLP